MLCNVVHRSAARSVQPPRIAALASGCRRLHGQTLGFIGLGKIGSGMVGNLAKAGASVVAYDRDTSAIEAVVAASGARSAPSIAGVAQQTHLVLTALPDDKVLRLVTEELLPALAERGGDAVHVSCSTVAPATTREMAQAHADKGVGFVSAPVFARPDGMRRGEATIPMSGPAWAKAKALPVLEKTAIGVHDFGEDVGAASAVKLGGNFLIAAAIEAMAEAAALAESHNVDREQFIGLMNTTIFDCLIYRGYGHRVGARDHFPHPDAHFALDLGSKDVSLVQQAAAERNCPMPVCDLLRKRFIEAQAAGRGKLDWSAIGLQVSEEAGSAKAGLRAAELLAAVAREEVEG